ncbi:MAG TPA: metal-binding protein [Chthonomonadaceae bacterium]|nr:metal-binding protein [Chthonomonadaceae bacterium]
MPGARTHDLITVVTAAGANVAYFTLTPHADPTLAALFTVPYLFAGYACAGDLDLDSKEYRRWGPLRFLWWPYRVIVPHRSWVSHGLILGGVIRVLYLAVICTLLFWGGLWLVSRFGPHLDPDAMTWNAWTLLLHFGQGHPPWVIAALGGFILAGTAHSLADAISTSLKRHF